MDGIRRSSFATELHDPIYVQLFDGGCGAGVAPLGHFGQELGPGLLGGAQVATEDATDLPMTSRQGVKSGPNDQLPDTGGPFTHAGRHAQLAHDGDWSKLLEHRRMAPRQGDGAVIAPGLRGVGRVGIEPTTQGL